MLLPTSGSCFRGTHSAWDTPDTIHFDFLSLAPALELKEGLLRCLEYCTRKIPFQKSCLQEWAVMCKTVVMMLHKFCESIQWGECKIVLLRCVAEGCCKMRVLWKRVLQEIRKTSFWRVHNDARLHCTLRLLYKSDREECCKGVLYNGAVEDCCIRVILARFCKSIAEEASYQHLHNKFCWALRNCCTRIAGCVSPGRSH